MDIVFLRKQSMSTTPSLLLGLVHGTYSLDCAKYQLHTDDLRHTTCLKFLERICNNL